MPGEHRIITSRGLPTVRFVLLHCVLTPLNNVNCVVYSTISWSYCCRVIMLRIFGLLAPKHFTIIWLSNLLTDRS